MTHALNFSCLEGKFEKLQRHLLNKHALKLRRRPSSFPVSSAEYATLLVFQRWRINNNISEKMSVHFKFKNSVEDDTVTFDGVHISVGDLKTAIIQKKKLRQGESDYQIMDSESKKGKFDLLFIAICVLIATFFSSLCLRIRSRPKEQLGHCVSSPFEWEAT